MSSSRDKILGKLNSTQTPFRGVGPVHDHLPVVPISDATGSELIARFVDQARKLSCEVHECRSEKDALDLILDVMGSDSQVMAWDFAKIPLPGLEGHLAAQGIRVSDPRNETVRVGITGVDAALASTGSLVLQSGADKPRLPSLLPPVHIAVVQAQQVLPNMEAWVADLRAMGLDSFRQVSGFMIISGPSRTADIAMQLTMGMHGPEVLHVLLLHPHA